MHHGIYEIPPFQGSSNFTALLLWSWIISLTWPSREVSWAIFLLPTLPSPWVSYGKYLWNSPLRLSGRWWYLVASLPSALTYRSLRLTRHLLHARTHLLAMISLTKFSFRENYPEINLLRFSSTRELWNSKSHWRLRTLFAAVSHVSGPLRKQNLA